MQKKDLRIARRKMNCLQKKDSLAEHEIKEFLVEKGIASSKRNSSQKKGIKEFPAEKGIASRKRNSLQKKELL